MSKEDIFWRWFYYGALVVGTWALFFLIWSTFGCNENPPHSTAPPNQPDYVSYYPPYKQEEASQTLSELSQYEAQTEPQKIDPVPIPLVQPTDEMWFEALRIYETGEDDYACGDKGLSRGAYQIQEGTWKDGLEHLGITASDSEWAWTLWSFCRPKAEFVLHAYWSRYKLNTWKRRIMAHKGLVGINNPSRVVYYERVKNIVWDLMRRKAAR